jgi:hypothetical protein
MTGSPLGIESTEASRREYRHLLFTTPGIEPFIAGGHPIRRDNPSAQRVLARRVAKTGAARRGAHSPQAAPVLIG